LKDENDKHEIKKTTKKLKNQQGVESLTLCPHCYMKEIANIFDPASTFLFLSSSNKITSIFLFLSGSNKIVGGEIGSRNIEKLAQGRMLKSTQG
jgi:hypothetical protein